MTEKKSKTKEVSVDILSLKKELMIARLTSSHGESNSINLYRNKKKEIAKTLTRINSKKK